MEFNEKFKCIYAIHSIEHVGLQPYLPPNHPENEALDPEGDFKVTKKLYEMLTPNGYLLITLPYGGYPQRIGVPGQARWRVFDRERLNQLLKDYKNYSLEFFGCRTKQALPSRRTLNSKRSG